MQSGHVLLFDLGGVLVAVASTERMLASLGLPADPTLVARWAAIEAWIRFETGEIDAATFGEQFAADFAMELDPAKVLLEFEAWNPGMLPGAEDLLAELRSEHRLAVLSDTNEVHCKRLAGEFRIPELVDFAFASHLIGLRKPDERAFRHVAAEIGVPPTDLVFFDDNPGNVDAALSLGIEAWQVECVAPLRQQLRKLGYL
jgi:glucose-1-phosphatase